MKVLIIGLGSIAKKHISAIVNLGIEVEFIALRSSEKAKIEKGVKNIYSWNDVPEVDFAIISSPTSSHYTNIEKALDLKVPLFIEKPPLMQMEGAERLAEKIEKNNVLTYVAFNLRFHPTLLWLEEYLRGKRILEVLAYCGSYLPDWRPDSDYRKTYSAREELGGGVHLDLIHEIDYLIWLLGKPIGVINQNRKISDLSITSFDSATYLLNYEASIAVIMLNYFRRDVERKIEIVFDDHTIKVDLINGSVYTSAKTLLFESHSSGRDTYKSQMRYFIDSIRSKKQPFNSFSESLETLKICLNDEA